MNKKAAVLFSGGKDSTYAMYLAKQAGYEIECLITIVSSNKESYMFHTPNISQTAKQAEAMDLPQVVMQTPGIKENELVDLAEIIKAVRDKYHIDTIVTGALYSEYQAGRIKTICDRLGLKTYNPLWYKNELLYLKELIDNGFRIMIVGVFAYPLDKKWLGRIIDCNFIKDVEQLKKKYEIHPAGEGGEFETFVLNCPLFQHPLEVKSFRDFKEGENSWRREIKI